MNKFEKWMIGSRKFPNLVYTKGERASAWVSVVMYFIALIGTFAIGTYLAVKGEDIIEWGVLIPILMVGLLIALFALACMQKIIIDSVARQYKDVL